MTAPTAEGEKLLESAKNLLFRVRQDNAEWFADEVYAIIKQLRVGLGDVEQHAKRLTAIAIMAADELEENERRAAARLAKEKNDALEDRSRGSTETPRVRGCRYGRRR